MAGDPDGVVDCPLGQSPHHHNGTTSRNLNKIITNILNGAELTAKPKMQRPAIGFAMCTCPPLWPFYAADVATKWPMATIYIYIAIAIAIVVHICYHMLHIAQYNKFTFHTTWFTFASIMLRFTFATIWSTFHSTKRSQLATYY